MHRVPKGDRPMTAVTSYSAAAKGPLAAGREGIGQRHHQQQHHLALGGVPEAAGGGGGGGGEAAAGAGGGGRGGRRSGGGSGGGAFAQLFGCFRPPVGAVA
jgi:hypothetical protein